MILVLLFMGIPVTHKTVKLFVLAGEPSGDKIGADLLKGLRDRQNFEIIGVGGPAMAKQGLESTFPMGDLAVMGIIDVVKRLPLLFWRMGQVVRHILREKPDAVILIDSQVFSEMIAKRLRAANYAGTILLYVAPTVWAWKSERAPRLKPLFDEVFGVLPFEPRALELLDGPKTVYVGHPALKAIPEALKTPSESGNVALLPGSRVGEIRRHLPLLEAVAERLASEPQVTGFILPTLAHLADHMRRETANWKVPVEVVVGADARMQSLQNCYAAVVTAGTITLELGLMGIPMVGTYVPEKWVMRDYDKAGRPMVALPNIILGRRVVEEVIPGPDMTAAVIEGALKLLSDIEHRQTLKAAFEEMRQLMEFGEADTPRVEAADRVMYYLEKNAL